jgi:protein TonB
VTGEVLVEFICDTEGNVRDVRVVKSTRSEFESAAIEAVSRLKFRPGRKGGRPVNARIQQPIVFSITDEQ